METKLVFIYSAVLLIGYCVVGAVRRLWLSPLSRFPGPKLPALTLWYEFYWNVINRGNFIWRLQEMHEKYGPIVRINPYELHINDPDFYHELYAGTPDKYPWWTRLTGAPTSCLGTVPHSLHRLRRGALNPFFSTRSITKVEPLIKSKVEKLSARFAALAGTKTQKGQVVRLDVAFMACTMDIICDICFADDRRYLDEPDFKLEWKETVLGTAAGINAFPHLPWLLPLTKQLPIWLVDMVQPLVAHLLRWRESIVDQVAPILAGTDSASSMDGEKARRTIFHHLRDSHLPEEEKTLERLVDEALVITGAGTETTAQTATRIMFYLKYVPGTLETLRMELDAAIPDGEAVPRWSELQRLPYLTAVIKEGLRLSYGITTRLPRVSHQDIAYKGHIIPAGTPVSQTSYFTLMNPAIFPEPNRFRPERWLEPRQPDQDPLERYLVPFGKGSRACLGINLAYAELYLGLATIVRRFDWEMYETTLDDIVCKHDYFVAVADRGSKGGGMYTSLAAGQALKDGGEATEKGEAEAEDLDIKCIKTAASKAADDATQVTEPTSGAKKVQQAKASTLSLVLFLLKLNKPEAPYLLLGFLGSIFTGFAYLATAIVFSNIIVAIRAPEGMFGFALDIVGAKQVVSMLKMLVKMVLAITIEDETGKVIGGQNVRGDVEVRRLVFAYPSIEKNVEDGKSDLKGAVGKKTAG